MNQSVYHIPLPNLAIALGFVVIVALIYAKWTFEAKTLLYATVRMLIQLLLIGFALTFIFAQQNAIIIGSILSVMLIMASWIALRPIKSGRKYLYPRVLLSIVIGCVFTLSIVVIGIVRLDPWHDATEIEVKIEGVEKSLQEAINAKEVLYTKNKETGVECSGDTIKLKKGSKELEKKFNVHKITLAASGSTLKISSENATRRESKMVGTIWAHVNNMIKGVNEDSH